MISGGMKVVNYYNSLSRMLRILETILFICDICVSEEFEGTILEVYSLAKCMFSEEIWLFLSFRF